jgi:hypothetical protein
MPFLLIRISRWIAFALVSLTLLLPWFRVPTGIREDVKGVYTVVTSEPPSTNVGRIIVILVLASAFLIGYRRRRFGTLAWSTPMALAGCFLLLVLGIIFPALTVQRCAKISAHAAWLHAQHYSFIVTIGDAFTSPEYASQAGEPGVEVREVLPRAFEAIPTPGIVSFSDLRLGKIEEILMWIGLSPAFCQFAYRGWFCGIIGSFLLAVSFVRINKGDGALRRNLNLAYRIAPFFVLSAFLLCTVCLVPILIAGRELGRSRTAVLEGNYADSLQHLDLAQSWVPILAYHTDFIYQRGWLERRLGLQSSATQLLSAIREEVEGFHARAAEHYADLLNPEQPGPIREEAFRGALRLAIQDFNSGLVDNAASSLTQLTALDPTCVKANYALQLADFRMSRKEKLESEVAKFEAVYHCFQAIDKGAIMASAHRRLAELEFDSRDFGKLGDEMRAAIKP